MAIVMNGIRGNSSEVKYPVNCTSRPFRLSLYETPAFTRSGSMSEAELDDLNEPKPDKKVKRLVPVIAYMLCVSLGKFSYYSFLDFYDRNLIFKLMSSFVKSHINI